MSEFVGRTGSKRVYSYPEAKFSALVGPFAENQAAGPGAEVFASAGPTGTVINWVLVRSTGASGTEVPITPKVTGRTVVEAVVGLHNTGGSPQDITVEVRANDVTLPFPSITISVPAGAFAEVPALAFVDGPIGSTANVSLAVIGSTDVNIVNLGSTLEVHEVPVATG